MSRKKDKKSKKKDEKKVDSESGDNGEIITDEKSSNILRSLTVIYGFFFVFMSAMVAGAQNLRVGFDFTTTVFFYVIIIVLSVACFLIGLEIYRILKGFGISNIGDSGITLLILFIPTAFIFVIGQALLNEVVVFGFSVAPLGVWIVTGLELLITSWLLWRERKED